MTRWVAALLVTACIAQAQGAGQSGDPRPYAERLAKAKASDWTRCVELLDPLMRDGVEDPAVLSRLGLCLSMLGESSRAESVLRRCVELAPGHDGCLNDLGAVLVEQGRHDEAMRYFERAVDLACAAGRYSASLEWLIGEYLDRGDLAAARRVLRIARPLAPNDHRRAVLDVLEARLALASGDGEAALGHLDSGRVERTLWQYPIMKSLVLAWLGRFAEAAALLRSRADGGSVPSPLDAELIRLGPAAFSGTASGAELMGLVHRFESDQRPWFLAAAAAHVRGLDDEACRLLARARARVEGSRSLLAPPWGRCPERGRAP